MEVQTDAGHLWDLRRGDFDDNRSSPRGRGWRALAVSAALEFNFLTAAVAFIWLIVVPAVLVGLAAPVVMALVHWKLGILTLLTSKPARALISLAVVSGVVLWSARPLVAMALDNFWHLHHTLVFPLFVALRELISMGLERLARGRLDPEQLHQRRRAGTVAAAALVAGGGLLLITTFQYSSDAPLSGLRRADLGAFAGAALGNAAVVLGLSTIVASLFWFWREITAAIPVFDWAPAAHPVAARTIRIAHLSDLHLLGERYGYRMETGTKGPCGNGRVADALCRLDAIRATQPLDLIVVSGDITDAGTRSEWVEFLGEVRRQPGLRGRLLFPATTTSTSSTARTQAGWTCRGA